MNRQQAIELLHAHMQNVNLRRHSYAVEAVMRALARHFSAKGGSASGGHGDEEVWGIAGLLHDADYEELKDANPKKEHTHRTVSWLKAYTPDPRIINAILAHGWKFVDGNPEPANSMEWSLYCCDELTGFIVAVALVRGKKLENVTVEAVLKKFPEKKFAAGVHREQIKLCEEKLNIPIDQFIDIAIAAMKEISTDLGL